MEVPKIIKKRKGYYRFLQRNLEFYMSDANLRRDKFIRSKLTADLELDASILLSCNRIRAVEATLKDLVIAIKPSKVLQLTDNGKVKRKNAIVEKSKEDVDKCTVYVERLPPDTTHEWLQRLFGQCGPVVMVSLPKYKTNKKVKGYAFVEFADESGCASAVQKYAELQACQLCQPPTVLPEPLPTIPSPIALPGPLIEPDPIPPPKPVTEEAPKDAEVKTCNEEDAVVLEEKKKRNRKKKKWQKRMNYTNIGLQVMSKVAWNDLRDRYLMVQAANRRAVKTHLVKMKRSNPRIGVGKIGIVPGTVLTVTAQKPVTETESKSLRSAIKQSYEGVEYVDVEPGQQSGYVRMTTPEAAAKLLAVQPVLQGYRLQLLPAEAEHLYWVKIQHDRDRRHNDGKKKCMSGARKLLLRAERQLAVKMRLSPNQ